MSDKNPSQNPGEAAPSGPGYQPPVPQPPTYGQPPVTEPPAYQPPSFGQPPVAEPPAYQPPTFGQPPAAEPPAYGQPPAGDPTQQSFGQPYGQSQPAQSYGQPYDPAPPSYGQPYGQAGGFPGSPYGNPDAAKAGKLALWSLILGIAGICCTIFGIAGAVMGFLALKELPPEDKSNRLMAQLGIGLGIAFAILNLILAIVQLRG